MKAIIAVLLVPLSAVAGVTDSSSDRFDFTETLWIYHMVDEGGIVYQAPIEYNERVGSVIVYEALDQYMAELGDPHEPEFFIQPSEEQPVLDKFVFVTGVSQKTYFLKDHWLGDGKKWVPMHPEDYKKLRSMIDSRRAGHGNLNPVEALEKFTEEVHSSGQQDVPPAWQPVQEHQEETPTEESANNQRPSHGSSEPPVVNDSHESENDSINEKSLKGQSDNSGPTVSHSDGIAEKRLSKDQEASIEDEGSPNAPPDQPLGAEGADAATGADELKNGNWNLVAIFSVLFLCYFLYARKKR
ncbi:hypothetical protein [Marinimicrobium agarilyticum]|uniref:hypothetical protein n=1 Tax=Marinimicrobium agarilyticum TaxID=306546 RepID=UPI00048A22B1|nr:hypothetical protein [Marinimicrobium agarilyticum]